MNGVGTDPVVAVPCRMFVIWDADVALATAVTGMTIFDPAGMVSVYWKLDEFDALGVYPSTEPVVTAVPNTHESTSNGLESVTVTTAEPLPVFSTENL